MTQFQAQGTLEITELSGKSVTNIQQDLDGLNLNTTGSGAGVTNTTAGALSQTTGSNGVADLLGEQTEILDDIHDTLEKRALSTGGGGILSGLLGGRSDSLLSAVGFGTLALKAKNVLSVGGTLVTKARNVLSVTGSLALKAGRVLSMGSVLALSAPQVLAVGSVLTLTAGGVLAVNDRYDLKASKVLGISGVLTIGAAGVLAITTPMSVPAAALITVGAGITIGAAELINIIEPGEGDDVETTNGSTTNPNDDDPPAGSEGKIPKQTTSTDIDSSESVKEQVNSRTPSGSLDTKDWSDQEAMQAYREQYLNGSETENRASNRQTQPQQLDIKVDGELSVDEARSAGVDIRDGLPPEARRQILDMLERELDRAGAPY